MRELFHQQMNRLNDTIVLEAKAVNKAMERASVAMRDANLAKAEKVIDSDRKIDFLERSIDEMGVSILARQAPVASDLRVVVSALRLSSILEQMGDLARHIAYVARSRYPHAVLPDTALGVLVKMAEHASSMAGNVALLLETRDLEFATAIEEEDDFLDDLHEKTFNYVLDEDLDLTRQEIIDIILLGRYLERFGDNAVAVAQRVQFMVNGIEDISDPFAEVDLTEI
ncbi:phosphate signaling complex protein PhoU [Arcanobacterium phocisimile]|uniref:Phosphate-specific transport system accessory protein PhoU n=1 Tax=Arcanobacterium phocisimile TaxID=1302235 RepID=A0ABX7IEU8_9ACTO|nr:phosphate signaling complex protein PhoU [Arcanobacterium phocisimile]QRV01669.1 phosphate signaling complex protein PhoU [Arcanobacterium phocisimile]